MSSRRSFLTRSTGALGLALGPPRLGAAAPDSQELVGRAVQFLQARQAGDGSWSGGRAEPGITALVVTALLRSRRVTPYDPTAARGLAHLERSLGADDGFRDVPHANYATAIAIMAFHEANRDGRYDAIIRGGQEFLKAKQWGEGQGRRPDDVFYGGAGYGGRSDRPDLSNTAFMVQALRETGLPADDPALRKALVFVSRAQNLDGEFNDQPWAKKVNDGGFIYTPANGGASLAGKAGDGGLRSYGSMTYAGLKSMIYAGLTPDDPRVAAACAFIRAHYALDENPGLGQFGLYYYYQTFAKALSILGRPILVDASGVAHDWRAELTAALADRQGPLGEWVNPADRFMEGDPNLVTAYGLLALADARLGG